MKFNEIKRLTSEGSYQTNVPFGYLPHWIEDNIKDGNLVLNPDFQRGHVWSEEQQMKFIEYMLRGGKSARIIHFNCPSWLKNVAPKAYNDFVCVDGLQRLTAVLKFMNNEIKAFDSYLNEFEDKIPLDIDLIINVNNLKTKEEVLTWYLEINSCGVIHTEEELEKVRKLLEKEKRETNSLFY